MKEGVRIGNGQGFWGDSPGAPARLIEQEPNLDYLTLDYLAEVSMSIMAIQRDKNPEAGYARDFLDVIHSLIPLWKAGSKVKIITNAGGLSPSACGHACLEILKEHDISMKVGVISGDSVYSQVKETAPSSVADTLVTANAYLGSKPIVESLQKGAHIVVTGRVADPSLTVAACVAHYQWEWDEYDRLAGATVAGHLIECGTQVTGGIATHWMEIPDVANLGFPIAEVFQDGSCTITKPKNSGGEVSLQTVKEQLLYEIGDPDNYLSPDVTVSFLSLNLHEEAPDRIHVSAAKGKPPPETYKVSATFRAGFKSEAMLAVVGPDAVKKAKRCGQLIVDRVSHLGYDLSKTHIECLGSGDIAPGVLPIVEDIPECVLRVCASDSRREALNCFAKEVASLVTSGPQGITGYTIGRPKVRPIFAYYPFSIPVSYVKPKIEVLG